MPQHNTQALGVATAGKPGASQTKEQGIRQAQGTQPTLSSGKSRGTQSTLPEQAGSTKQPQAKETAEGSNDTKSDADQATWSAQLLTARRQLGAHPAYSVHTARTQMDIALKYIKVKEGGLERINKQAETVKNREGAPLNLLLLTALLLLLHSNIRCRIQLLSLESPHGYPEHGC